jgi:hypothetical protein
MAAHSNGFAASVHRYGAYEILAQAQEGTIKAGEIVRIHLVITGYGYVTAAKIHCSPPLDLIDTSRAIVYYDYTQERVGNELKLGFGAKQEYFKDYGFTISLGVQQNVRTGATSGPIMHMPDKSGDGSVAGPMVHTELIVNDKSVITVEAWTKRTAKKGFYDLAFVLTYSDGRTWKTSKTVSQIRVQGFFERNPVVLPLVGLLFVILQLTIPSEKLYPVWPWLVGEAKLIASDILSMLNSTYSKVTSLYH